MSCDDDTISSRPKTKQLDFLNAVGNQWAYFVYDSLAEAADTVDVRIEGFASLPDGGGQAKVWTYSYRNWTNSSGAPRVDTEYVQIVGDTIKIHRPYPPELVTVMQNWRVGQTWTSGEDYIDTTTIVTDDERASTPAGLFTDVLLIERNWLAFEVGNESSTLYYSSEVGWAIKHFKTAVLPEEDSNVVNEIWGVLSFTSAE
jgi:hypothetical protein